jgi:hypothetical protein
MCDRRVQSHSLCWAITPEAQDKAAIEDLHDILKGLLMAGHQHPWFAEEGEKVSMPLQCNSQAFSGWTS